MNVPPVISPAERRVLDYLKRASRCEVSSLARSLGVTPMAVRHPLAVLERAGLIKTTLERRVVGRPRHVYSLSAAAEDFFPRDYGELASTLIRTILELDGESKVAHIFKRMKEKAVARHAPRMVGKTLRDRVAEMAKIMTEAGYMAEWEQLDARTFQIMEHNCAISCVAQECHQACESELAMLRALLKAPVSRQEHIASGDRCCRYLVRFRAKPKSARS